MPLLPLLGVAVAAALFPLSNIRSRSGNLYLPALAELAQRYELPFAEPEWLPDVIARYGPTPPGA